MNKADMDQKLAEVRVLLTLWWSIYSGCLEKGFTEQQAIELLKVFIARPTENV